MSSARSNPRRARPLRGGAPARLVVVLAVVAGCAFGLSACRTIGPGAEAAKEPKASPELAVAPPASPATQPAATSPTSPSTDATSPAAQNAAALAVPDPETTPVTVTTPETTPTGRASATPRAAGAAGTSPTTPASAPTASQPPKLVVDRPWDIVGRPFVVDATSPRVTTTGLTSFRLIFRTRGDFRGVRAGTQVTDERHYKVGPIELPELPGYVPTGQSNLRLGDRNKSNGRYCWIATIAKPGSSAGAVFPARAGGVALGVDFDLYRSTSVQHRTAPVFVRTRAGEQPSALQNALGCHLNYFS